MAISKEKKQSVVATFKEILAPAESVAFVKFNRLTVKDANELRRNLRAEGISYKVGKKTLLKRVLEEIGITGELPVLEGEIAIAASADALAPARVVYEFQKTHKDMVTLVGGVFEGGYKNKEEMMVIATIPSRVVLLSQIAFLLKSPLQRLAIAIDQVSLTKASK